ncbi:hypothetical protein A1O7_06101 [Cladophialophora yegresii CBS 114405]|uniref:Uncharacterized protein n=1 Tax=Cladophialophora yegresii CBS 114405 TaxID=1182544 RepID=W9VSY1_9EURO|nr:uncharacterized protein A1O7_06101 [Cladophialophora yegresii CBS 114405]EXJ58673.1 hypothetical protein A1O7_06101 [Cladophialophora yegresii CBS 114405]
MPPPPYTAEPGNWFLRGVQSAVFYYVSCTPWVEFKHKRKRRKEAKEQAQERADVVVTQPGRVRQPAPFQTNEAWAEELMLGPGPPKGWKKDSLLAKLQNKVHKEPIESSTPDPEMHALQPQPTESSATPFTESATELSSASGAEEDTAKRAKSALSPTRSLRERRLSNAVDNIKESLRISLHPPKWNWKRYDREDEILAGFTERVTRIWNRATLGIHRDDAGDEDEQDEPPTHKRKRALTNESERYDYYRARHPEVNDMHPPIVSQLPAGREEVAWMLLPPPSAAVMEARTRPAAEPEMRWPLCVIGRPLRDTEPKLSVAKTQSTEQIHSQAVDLSTDAEDEDDSLDSIDDPSEDESVQDGDIRSENQNSSRIKHLSDPIIRPPPIHPVSRIAGDLLVPKRRDSWQIHYVVPSCQPVEW